MQTWYSDEKAVRPSVCLFVCQTRELRQNGRISNLSRILYHTKEHLAYFSVKKNGWWGRPLLPKILGQLAPVGAKSPILTDIRS